LGASGHRYRAGVPRQRWEYTVLTFRTDGAGWIEGLVNGLDAEGDDGWEAVGIVGESDDVAHLLMKRPK
jgi:hypothetical protein